MGHAPRFFFQKSLCGGGGRPNLALSTKARVAPGCLTGDKIICLSTVLFGGPSAAGGDGGAFDGAFAGGFLFRF